MILASPFTRKRREIKLTNRGNVAQSVERVALGSARPQVRVLPFLLFPLVGVAQSVAARGSLIREAAGSNPAAHPLSLPR